MSAPICNESFAVPVSQETAFSVVTDPEFVEEYIETYVKQNNPSFLTGSGNDKSQIAYKVLEKEEYSFTKGKITDEQGKDILEFDWHLESTTLENKKKWTKITVDVYSLTGDIPPKHVEKFIKGLVAAIISFTVGESYANPDDGFDKTSISNLHKNSQKATRNANNQQSTSSAKQSRLFERTVIASIMLVGLMSMAFANPVHAPELDVMEDSPLTELGILDSKTAHSQPIINEYSEAHFEDGSKIISAVGPNNVSEYGHNEKNDMDPDEKAGGLDPLVFGGWNYVENPTMKCETQHKFDYDNDGFVENFCYEIVGSIFVIDFNGNGNIDNGAEMLNFYRTSLDGYNPVTFIQENPNVCNEYSCYLWHDSVKNWSVDEYELVPFSFDVDYVRHYPDGKKLVDNGKYAYCSGESLNGEKFYCLQPTYWQKGILE